MTVFQFIRTFTKGDVNGDGDINILDVIETINIILGKLDPTPDQFRAADINGDKVIDILDVLGIVNVILGIG